MGMTMVEKILAKATDQPTVKAGDVLEPNVTWPCRTKTVRWSSTSSTRSTKTPGWRARSGIPQDRDHLRPPRAGGKLKNGDQPEKDP